MNSSNGRIYTHEEAITAARKRGEPVISVTQDFASYAQCQSAAHAKKLARALTNVRRNQPDLGQAEAEALAKKSVAAGR